MDGGDSIEITVLGGLDEIAAAEWDACAGDGGRAPAGSTPSPPTASCARSRTSGSVGRGTGWTPRHLVARDGRRARSR